MKKRNHEAIEVRKRKTLICRCLKKKEMNNENNSLRKKENTITQLI
jgi:hypothetical protein